MLLNTFNYKTGIFDDFPALKQLEKKRFVLCIVCFPGEEESDCKKLNTGEEKICVTSMLILFMCFNLYSLI